MGRPRARREEAYESPNRSLRIQKPCHYLLEFFTTYEMPKFVLIKFSCVGVLYRLIQVSIVTYFIAWVFVKEKGYQASERPIHGVSAQVRGTTFSHTERCIGNLASGLMVYTDADLVQPPIQNAGFFLITRVYSIVDQFQNECAEAPDLLDARCRNEEQCPVGNFGGDRIPEVFAHLTNTSWFDVEMYGHGPFTGRCLAETMTCEAFAWCPIVENTDRSDYGWYPSPQHFEEFSSSTNNLYDSISEYFLDRSFIEERTLLFSEDILNEDKVTPLYEVLNFTVLIHNSIEFPVSRVKIDNILSWMDASYLETCFFNSSDTFDRHCPRFRIQDIISLSGVDMWYIFLNGGIIDITIHWDCNLDMAPDKCLPAYSIRYLDAINNTEQEEEMYLTRMEEKYFLEYANYFGSKRSRRMLHKVNGIQFLISVTGKGGRFSLLEFSMKIGSCMALFGTATLFCNLVLAHFSCDRERYRKTICRLGNRVKNKSLLRRLHSNPPPPKPALILSEKLTEILDSYAESSGTTRMSGLKINVRKQGEKCVAIVTEVDREGPSIVMKKRTLLNVNLSAQDKRDDFPDASALIEPFMRPQKV